MGNGDVLERAIHFAVDAHRGVVRKLGGGPYILHPLEALVFAAGLTGDREVLAAMVLHDVVEDAGVSLAELRENFGDRVAELVASETEDKRRDLPARDTWRVRKAEALERLRAAEDPAVKILWLSDKLSNMRSIRAAWQAEGHAIWSQFNQSDPAQQAWYYRSAAEALSSLRDTPTWWEYANMVEEVFAFVPKES